MKRKRQSIVGFQTGTKLHDKPTILEPGVYRMFDGGRYYASFIIHRDQTVELYGSKLDVRDESNCFTEERK